MTNPYRTKELNNERTQAKPKDKLNNYKDRTNERRNENTK